MARVYMSKDMQSWLHEPYFFKQSCTAEIQIEVITWRGMGDENICIKRDPVLPRG
jgi:hypothetical protein